MKNLIYILFASLTIVSCKSPQDLFDKGVEKIEKAIERDPTLSFPTDTIRTVEHDTIQGVDGKDSIIRITERIEVPCDFTLEDLQELRSLSRRELRNERKMRKDSMRHMERLYKLETKRLKDSLNYQKKLNKELTKRLDDQTDTQVKLAKEETKQLKGNWLTRFLGRIWWLLFIIGFGLGVYFSNFIKKFLPFLNRTNTG